MVLKTNEFNASDVMEDKEEPLTHAAECNVCGKLWKNWVGSTPCCGSIAWVVKLEEINSSMKLYTL